MGETQSTKEMGIGRTTVYNILKSTQEKSLEQQQSRKTVTKNRLGSYQQHYGDRPKGLDH